MNMIRKIFFIMLAAAMLTAISTTASAMSPSQPNNQLRYVGVSSASANLTISTSGKATASARVYVAPDYTANLDVSLERDSGTIVKSWSSSGTASVSVDDVYYVTRGHDYYVSASVDVFNENGKLVDSFTISSATVTY